MHFALWRLLGRLYPGPTNVLACFVLCSLVWPRAAWAGGDEPLLWLAMVRQGALDRVASEQVREQLLARKDFKVVDSPLTDEERRCRTSPCLTELARKHTAYVVLSGDVFQLGDKKMQRVVLHLYDGRHRQVFDVENLCNDCDETKLGLLVQGTVSEILNRYRGGQDADAQLNDLLDKTPHGPPEIPEPNNDPVLVPPLPVAPPPVLAQRVTPSPPPPVQAVAVPSQKPTTAETVGRPAVLPPMAQSWPQTHAPRPEARPETRENSRAPGLSKRRKTWAAVLGTFGVLALGGSIAAHALDRKLDASLNLNAGGAPCSAAAYQGQTCVLTTVGLWAPGYAASGLLIGGMILTLAVP